MLLVEEKLNLSWHCSYAPSNLQTGIVFGSKDRTVHMIQIVLFCGNIKAQKYVWSFIVNVM